MIGATLHALMAHWWRNPLQLATFVGGLALATALWSGVQAINAEARASYDAAASTLGDGQFDEIVARDGRPLTLEDFVTLRRNGWLVSPLIEGDIADGVRLIGIEPLTAPPALAGTGTADDAAGPGNPVRFIDPGMIVGTQATLDRLAALAGEAELVADPAAAPDVAITDIGIAAQLLGQQTLSRLILLPQMPVARADLATIAPDLQQSAARQSADIGQLTGSFHLNLTAFGFLSFAVGIFIVQSAIGLALEQRRPMMRTLRALGVPLRTLIALIVTEFTLLAVLAGFAGLLLGYGVAALLLPDVAATLQGLYGAQIAGSLQWRAQWLVSGMAIALAGTALALAGRLWQIARMPLLASAQAQAWVAAGRRMRWVQAGGALALLAAAGVLVLLGKGLVAGFALLACLLLGAALLLPVLVDGLLQGAGRWVTAPVPTWFLADTRQQMPGLSLALMALLLALSANVGVSTMVSSFRLTFTGFLDQRLAPELYVRVGDAALAKDVHAFLERDGLAGEVLPILTARETILDLPTVINGVRVGPTYRDNWAFVAADAAPWDQVGDGEAIIINEQLANRTGTGIGDRVDLIGAVALPVAGIVADYGNPRGQVYVSEALFQRLFPGAQAQQFGLRTSEPDSLRETILGQFDLGPDAVIDQQAIKAFSVRVFERTFAVTGALNVLTLAVAGFAMLMSLLTLADLRLPHLAPVWALGLTRAQLGRLELMRAVLLALLVAIFAIPLGLALAWVLLAIINVEAFGWRLPMFLFPVDYARLGAYALIAAMLAAAWPAWRLMRKPPSAFLRVFANEA